MSINSRIRERREALNMSRADLAEKIGVTASAVANYENEISSPKVEVMFKIFEALKCDANYLYQDDLGSNFPMKVSYDEMEHIKKYRTLDTEGQSHVDTILEWESARIKTLSDFESHPAAVIDIKSYTDPAKRYAEYYRSASAGDGIFILGNEVTAKIEMSESDWDPRVDYVINVSGNSMEPDFCDGDKVMVSQRVEMRHGDVGIFIVNGAAYIKEYGNTELISRNPDCPNIKIAEYDNIVCMGKVIRKILGEYKIIEN